jgi:urease accessory protein
MKRILASLPLLLLPSVALAHPGHGLGFEAGALHPFTGADHLLAMTGVGLWAATLGGRAKYALPLAFLAAMAAGAVLVPGLGTLTSTVEPMVLASVFLLGGAVALTLRVRLAFALPLVALMGLAHGAAHGTEGSGAGFGLGMLAATAALHGLGLGLGLTLNRAALRISGAVAFLAGVTLAFAG